jgi:hypothetical protein
VKARSATTVVYLLVHDDRMYDTGDVEVRGVYNSREAAEQALVTRTPSGAPSQAYDAHNAGCCGVQEWNVESLGLSA